MSFQHLDIPTLQAWLVDGRELALVDIRDPMSFSRGRIPSSRRLDNDGVSAFLADTPAERPVVVVCYHGHSSQQAAAWLTGQGLAEVYSLDGGFTEWQLRHPDSVEA